MSDHYHYGYADERHSHSEYAESYHDHALDYAEKYHSHHDTDSTMAGLREDLSAAEARIWDLEQELGKLAARIQALEPYEQPAPGYDVPPDTLQEMREPE